MGRPRKSSALQDTPVPADFSAAAGDLIVPALWEKSNPQAHLASAIAHVEADRLREGIGTLGEKTLHAVLKLCYEPDMSFHEQKIGARFADIAREGEIIEIQTKQLFRLRAKIEAFLAADYRVTVVYPIPHRRTVYWIGENGKLSGGRKSPKVGQFCSAAAEVEPLADLLAQEGFTLHLLLLDVEDFRNTDGFGKGKKRGSTRYERLPLSFVDARQLTSPDHCRALLPPALPSPFTAADFCKAGKYTSRAGSYALKLFRRLHIVRQVGQRGRAYLYEVE